MSDKNDYIVLWYDGNYDRIAVIHQATPFQVEFWTNEGGNGELNIEAIHSVTETMFLEFERVYLPEEQTWYGSLHLVGVDPKILHLEVKYEDYPEGKIEPINLEAGKRIETDEDEDDNGDIEFEEPTSSSD